MYYEDRDEMMEMLYLDEIQLEVLWMLFYYHRQIYFADDHRVNHVQWNQHQLKEKNTR